MKNRQVKGKIFEALFRISAVIAAIILIVIIGFIFVSGFPAIKDYGFFDMIFNSRWAPDAKPAAFGLSYMILATFATTLLSLIVAVPVGILCSLYLSKMATPKLKQGVMFFVELLAGIPSVIFGFFVLRTIVKGIYDYFYQIHGVVGNSMLAAVVVLALMSLPTIISISVSALDAVDKSYKEASLALGANNIQTMFKVDLRAAKTGIFSAIVLGAGKVIGETMAVMLVSGNAVTMPGNILFPIRTLTANIATEMGYASGLHQSALYATGIILFILIMILNFVLLIIMKKGGANNA